MSYDGNDRLTSLSDARGATTKYTFNELGEQLAISSPDTGTATAGISVARQLRRNA
jgi:YD repeat-containing protein